ncbi:MAG: hypothetical protein EOP86_13080 [Verrucomicrobiaceae bacterium]|nr:MAG: hypothetical protein EOP86_13080 [Verrucomicrobiaceae bacterium]
MRPILPLPVFLFLGFMCPVRAGLFWADHSDEILFGSTYLRGNNTETVFTLTGHAGSLGTVDSTFSSSGGFWVDYGYKNSGSHMWCKPGYITSLSKFPLHSIHGNWSEVSRISDENGFGIPPLPPGSVLRASGWYNSTVSITSRFEHLPGGVLPAGSWICCGCDEDSILTVSAVEGWMARRFTAAAPQSDRPPAALLSVDGAKAVYQYPGAVFVQTAIPLTEVSASVIDPTPWISYDGRGSGVMVDFAVAVATPDNWIPPVRTQAPFQITSFEFWPADEYYSSGVRISWPAEMEASYSVQASPDLDSWTTMATMTAQKWSESVILGFPSELDGRPRLHFRVIRN